MNKKYIALTLGIVCLLLSLGISVQLKTMSTTSSYTTGSSAENKLRDEVFRWKDKYDTVYKQLEEAEEVLEKERKSATENSTEAADLEKELLNAKTLLGQTEVKGKGVVITLDDNKALVNMSSISIDPNVLLVHDGDIIQVVSILKNAGAEAISINDQRIVNTTAITCDGYVVRINGEKVGAPYEIKAIGSPEYLKGSLEVSGYIDMMIEDGVMVDIKKSNSITIPKYEGVLTHKYMIER
ncbi:MAG: DUF881 domain-containing protein [Clostridia bacterium]|nr:DUF881 domain-containing protein [Clostridia bacterium]